jgi:indolepyruvate ferredoxin oxidoreductase beta subunit
VGTGGQGLITLLEILSDAAIKQGLDSKTSELHGLSQRGGSVEVHIKFGKQVFSPMVAAKSADLIVGLEMQECLKAAYFANKETQYLINETVVPIPGKPPIAKEEIVKNLRKFTKKIEIVNASEICEKELGNAAVAGVYLLCRAAFEKMISLKPEMMLEAIKSSVAPKHLDINVKAYQLAQKHSQDK